MANVIGSAVLEITADISKADMSVREFEGRTKGKLGALAGAVGGASAAVVAGVAAVGVAAVKMGSDVQSGMAEVRTLLPELTDEGFGRLNDELLTFSSEMGIATSDAIPALYQAISAGVPQENVFDFLRTSADLSVGGVTDLNTAVDGLTTVVNSYGAETISAGEASDILFTAVKLGKTTVDELSASLYQVTPVASNLGVGFDEVAAAMAHMTSQGVPTAQSATQLRQVLVEAADSGSTFSTNISELTDKSFAALIEQGVPMHEALSLIRTDVENAGGRFSEMFGSVEAANAALALTGPNSDAAGVALDAMATATGAAGEAAATMRGTFEFGLNQLMTEFKNILAEAGNTIIPVLTPLLQELGENLLPVIMEAVQTLVPVFAEWIIMLAQIAAEIMPPLIEILRVLIDTVLPPLQELFSAIMTELMPPLVQLFSDLFVAITPLVEELLPGLITVLSFIVGEVLPPLIEVLTWLVNNVLAPLILGVVEVRRAFVDGFNAIWDAVSPIVENILGVMRPLLEFIGVEFSEGVDESAVAVSQSFADVDTAATEMSTNSIAQVQTMATEHIAEFGKIQTAAQETATAITETTTSNAGEYMREVEANRARVERQEELEKRRREGRKTTFEEEETALTEHIGVVETEYGEHETEMSESHEAYLLKWAERSADAYAERLKAQEEHQDAMLLSQEEYATASQNIMDAVNSWNTAHGEGTDYVPDFFTKSQKEPFAKAYDADGNYVGFGGTHDITGRDKNNNKTGTNSSTRESFGLKPVDESGPPKLPGMALGGIVNRATHALIGEAGPEAVIPIDRLDRMLDGFNRMDRRKGRRDIVLNMPVTIHGSVYAEDIEERFAIIAEENIRRIIQEVRV